MLFTGSMSQLWLTFRYFAAGRHCHLFCGGVSTAFAAPGGDMGNGGRHVDASDVSSTR